MTETSVLVRHLRHDDVAAVAVIHRNAFPGFFLSVLGARFLRQMYRGFLDDPTCVAFAAVDDRGRVVGAVVGTTDPPGLFGRMLRRRWTWFARAAASAAVRDPRVVPRLVRGMRYRGGAHPGATGALLSSICVDPDAQGAGVGRALLRAWTDGVVARGVTSAYLTTDAVDNEDANRFYTSNGWSLAGTITTPEGRAMSCYTIDLGRSAC